MILHIFGSAVQAHPLRPSVARKTCGSRLTERISKICETRGGHRTSTHARVRRGVYNECCQSKCTDESLYDYCNDSNHDHLKPRSALIIETEDLQRDLEQNTENTIEKSTSTTEKSPLTPQIIVEQQKKIRKDYDFGTVAPEYNMRPIIRLRKPS